MPEVPIAALADAVRHAHGATATFVECVPVVERLGGRVVWDRAVVVFDLEGHPRAKRAYAWSAASQSGGRARVFTTVLHEGPIDSPVSAVRASIAKYRADRGR